MRRSKIVFSVLLILCISVVGCGKIDKADNTDKKKQTTSEQFEEMNKKLEEEATPTPAPNDVVITEKEPYQDLKRSVSMLGLKEYKKIKTEKFTDKASKGKVYLVLFLKIRNTTDKKDYINVNNLSAKVDGKKIENTYLLNDLYGYSTIFTNIQPNTTEGGFIVWEVPENWKKMDVCYEGWKGSDGLTINYNLTKDDLKKPEKYERAIY